MRAGGEGAIELRLAPIADVDFPFAVADPVADSIDGLPRPSARFVLGDRLRDLLLDLGEHLGEHVGRSRHRVGRGADLALLLDDLRQTVRRQVRVLADLEDEILDGLTRLFRKARRVVVAPLVDQMAACLSTGQMQQQAAREPDGVGAEAAHRRGELARKQRHCAGDVGHAQLVEPKAERRGHFLEEVAAEMGDGLFESLGSPVGERQDVDAGVRHPLVLDPLAVRAVLGVEQDRRVAVVVDLGESRVGVGELVLGRHRVVRGAAHEERVDRGFGMPELAEEPAHRVAQVGDHAAGPAAGGRENVDARRRVAEGEAGRGHRFVDAVGVRDFLDLAAKAGQEPLLVVGERESTEGPAPLRLQRSRHRIKLFARQPLVEVVEVASAIVADRLQRQVQEVVPSERDLRRSLDSLVDRVRIGVDRHKAEQRNLREIAESIEEPAAQLEHRLAAE